MLTENHSLCCCPRRHKCQVTVCFTFSGAKVLLYQETSVLWKADVNSAHAQLTAEAFICWIQQTPCNDSEYHDMHRCLIEKLFAHIFKPKAGVPLCLADMVQRLLREDYHLSQLFQSPQKKACHHDHGPIKGELFSKGWLLVVIFFLFN